MKVQFLTSHRAVINLAELEREKTHMLDQPLEDGAGFIKLLLTISGTSGGESISDLANYTPNPREREDIVRKYVRAAFSQIDLASFVFAELGAATMDDATVMSCGGRHLTALHRGLACHLHPRQGDCKSLVVPIPLEQ